MTTMKRKRYAATYARSEESGRRTGTRRKRVPPPQKYGAIFFVMMGVTVASAIGFLGVVAQVMAK